MMRVSICGTRDRASEWACAMLLITSCCTRGSIELWFGVPSLVDSTFLFTAVQLGEDSARAHVRKVKTFHSKKYGISHARFAHRSQNIIHASTKGDDHALRYHSMHDNKYLSYFKGHTGR
jgi:hypothetical protein